MRTLYRNILCLLMALMLALPSSAQKSSGKKLTASTIESALLMGVESYNNADFKQAEAVFKAVLAEAPDNDAAYYYLGMCRLRAKDAEEAETYLRKAAELDPSNYWYRDRLAALYAMTGRIEITTRMYEELLEDFPKKNELYYSLVEMYISQNRYEDALEKLNCLEEIFGKSDATVMTRYQLLIQMQRQEEAHRCLLDYSEEYSSPEVLSVLGDYEMSLYNDTTALKYYNEALYLDNSFAPAILGKAEVFRTTRKYDEFFSTINGFMAMESVPTAAKSNYLTAIYRQTDPKFQKSFRPNVDRMFDIANRTHPSDTAILFSTGVYYLGTERVPKADSCFQAIVAACPQDARSTNVYCSFLSFCKDWDRLSEVSEKAAETFPDDSKAFLDFATLAAYQKEDYQKVIDISRRVAESTDDKSVKLSAYSSMGDMYHMLGEKKQAYKMYERCLKIDPNYAPVLNNYAYFLSVDGKKLSKAYAMSRKVIDAEPDNATYLDTFGWILYLQKKPQEAKGVFKHAMLYGGKESATILDHYADVLFELKEYDLAFIYWKQALQKDVNNEIPNLAEKIERRKAQVGR